MNDDTLMASIFTYVCYVAIGTSLAMCLVEWSMQ